MKVRFKPSAFHSPVLTDGSAVYTPGISERRGGQTSYYQNDLLGSPTSITNSGGGITDNSLFEAFGGAAKKMV